MDVARVLKARHRADGTAIALKVLRPEIVAAASTSSQKRSPKPGVAMDREDLAEAAEAHI